MTQMDPWRTGTPGYRVALLTGMGGTFLGIMVLIIAAVVGSESVAATLRTTGLVLIGIGLFSHLAGIGLRRRQAAHIIRDRRNRG